MEKQQEETIGREVRLTERGGYAFLEALDEQ